MPCSRSCGGPRWRCRSRDAPPAPAPGRGARGRRRTRRRLRRLEVDHPGRHEPRLDGESYRFDPDVVRIEAGETVTWTNNDNFTHTVRVDGQPDHKVGRDDSVSITFSKSGTYRYECTLHSHDMQGTVIVT